MNGYDLPSQSHQGKHHIMLNQVNMEKPYLCKSKLLKEEDYFSIQDTNDMIGPHQVKLPWK